MKEDAQDEIHVRGEKLCQQGCQITEPRYNYVGLCCHQQCAPAY